MIINGKAIAGEILQGLKNELSHQPVQPHLTIITAAPSFASQRYITLKKRRASEVGIGVSIIELPATVTTADVQAVVARAAMQTDGIIVQLPLPALVDVEIVVQAIPEHYDVDGMRYHETKTGHLPPVVAAIGELAERADILLAGQAVVVVGHGRLVGEPIAIWARSQGASVSVVTEDTDDAAEQIASADILILGAGQPGMVTPDMIRDGVVIFDAGTSEVDGQLAGDADPACSQKAALFTPVPGGIGPLTVAMLLKNVVEATVRGAK